MPTVSEFAESSGNGTCSTEGLRGLNDQIFALLRPAVSSDLVSCAHLVSVMGASAIPFLQPAALRALDRAVQEKGEGLKLNHAYRTLAHQVVLARWGRLGRCSITLVAQPGTSPHEKAIAIDIKEHQRWITVLGRHNWRWRGNADKPHFTFIGGGVSTRVLTESIRAFQKLWNIHNPGDRIGEDGIFGNIETRPRLLRSPVNGFTG
jgi:N-acetylmuramoyl-L-alanine amidase